MLNYIIGGLTTLLLSIPIGLILIDKFTRYKGTMPLFHIAEKWGFHHNEVPNLSGKTIIVTGSNSGLGYGSAEILAMNGADVYMAVRSLNKGEEAKKEMINRGKITGSLTVMELDNNSLKSVKNFAKEFKKLGKKIDSLILNAGIMIPPFELTKDGIESQFGVNHIAHFALTKDLLDLMNENSTIVSVSSLGHWFTVDGGVFLDLKKINDEKAYTKILWYGQSKLANLLFAKELNRRLGNNKKVFVNAVHPGAVTGGLNRHIAAGNKIFEIVDQIVQKFFYWTQNDGALSVLCAAVSPGIVKENIRGQYFVPIARLDPGSSYAQDAKLAENLWEFSENILKEKGWDSM